jgi:hypothetical protein
LNIDSWPLDRPNRHGAPMSPSVSHRRQPGRPRRPSRGRNRPPQRLAIFTVVIRSALVVTVVGSIAGGGYFAFRDNLLARPMTEMKITAEDQIADLRAQADRIMSRLDQRQVEQQVNALLQRQAMLEQQISALTDDLQSATASINSKTPAPDSGGVIGTNGPPVAAGALAVSKPRSASAHHRLGPRAHRRLAGRPRQHGGDQAAPAATPAPAATQTDLGKPSLIPN